MSFFVYFKMIKLYRGQTVTTRMLLKELSGGVLTRKSHNALSAFKGKALSETLSRYAQLSLLLADTYWATLNSNNSTSITV